MNWKDRSKEIFNEFSLNFLLKYRSHKREIEYLENYDFLQLSGNNLEYLYLILQMISFLSSYHTWNLCVCVTFFTLLIAFKGSSYNKYVIFFSYFFSPMNYETGKLALLLLELIFHYAISKSLLLYLFSLYGRLYLYQNFTYYSPEVIFCVAAFIILTKDLKHLWAMQGVYLNLEQEMHFASQNSNFAHFILDDQGNILEMNNLAISIINFLNPSHTNTLASIFQENICDYFFAYIKTSNKNPKPEQEFMLINNSEINPKLVQKFSSVSIKIFPIQLKNKKIFAMVFTDISQQVLERRIILKLTKKSHNYFESVYKKYLNLYGLHYPPIEPDISLLKSCILQEIEAKNLMSYILAATDINIIDFNLKTEVINTIQIVWSTLNLHDTKFHLLIDKDISVVKTDVHKHNLIVKILLEFYLKYFDKNSNLIINVGRLSLEKIQYKFKFYSDKLTHKKVQKLFDRDFRIKNNWKSNIRQKILICLHLIQVLNGEIDEISVNSELRKVIIRFSIIFNLGASQKCSKLSLINIPKDTVIFTWPFCTLPKRTNLSLTKLRKIIHSNTQSALSTDCLPYSKSYEL